MFTTSPLSTHMTAVRQHMAQNESKQALDQAKQLNRQLLQSIQANIQGTPLGDREFTFLADGPYNTLFIDSTLIQNHPELACTLSKTHRLILELACYQSLRKGNPSDFETIQKKYSQASQLLLSHLTEPSSKHEFKIQMNICWIQELANQDLNIHIKSRVSSDFIHQFPRWIGTQITQLEELTSIEGWNAKIEQLNSQSPRDTLNMVHLFMILMRRPEVNKALKDYAFDCLQKLANLKDNDTTIFALLDQIDLSQNPSADLSDTIDRFWQTRVLAQECLVSITKVAKEHYQPYREASQKMLQALEATETSSTILEQYKEHLEKRKKEALIQGKVWAEKKKEASHRGDPFDYDAQITNCRSEFNTAKNQQSSLQNSKLRESLNRSQQKTQKIRKKW